MAVGSNGSAPAGDARALRLQRLRRAVDESGRLHLRTAAQLLNVSEMTIRRDLASSDASLACLGGYVVDAAFPTVGKYAIEQELDQHAQHKLLACRRAVETVGDGDTLFIDCGSTMQSLAECLPRDLSLSVICFSMNVAERVTQRPNTQVMLLGGLYHISSQSFSSDEALAYLRKIGINKAFISAGGVHPARGASCSNFHEVAVKQAAIASAMESVLVVDESKLGSLKPAFFADLGVFASIVVGGPIGADVRKQFKSFPLDIAAK